MALRGLAAGKLAQHPHRHLQQRIASRYDGAGKAAGGLLHQLVSVAEAVAEVPGARAVPGRTDGLVRLDLLLHKVLHRLLVQRARRAPLLASIMHPGMRFTMSPGPGMHQPRMFLRQHALQMWSGAFMG